MEFEVWRLKLVAKFSSSVFETHSKHSISHRHNRDYLTRRCLNLLCEIFCALSSYVVKKGNKATSFNAREQFTEFLLVLRKNADGFYIPSAVIIAHGCDGHTIFFS